MEEQIVRAINLGFKVIFDIVNNTVDIEYEDETFFFEDITKLRIFLDFAETLKEGL